MKFQNLLIAIAVFAITLPVFGAQAQTLAVHKSIDFESVEFNRDNKHCLSASTSILHNGNLGLEAIAEGKVREYKKHRNRILKMIRFYESECGGEVTVQWYRLTIGEERTKQAIRILDDYAVRSLDEEFGPVDCDTHYADMETSFLAHQAAFERFELDPNHDDLEDLTDAYQDFSYAYNGFTLRECGTVKPSVRVKHYDVR